MLHLLNNVNIKNIFFSGFAINLVVILSLVLVILQFILEINLHRIPYAIVFIFALFVILQRQYIYKKNITAIIIIFTITTVGLVIVGSTYTSTLSPLIYGLLFFTMMDKKYSFNFVLLYKLLAITIFIELVIINVISDEFFNSFLSKGHEIIHSSLSSKLGHLIGYEMVVPVTIFNSPQIASMILVISLFIFNKYTFWWNISIIMFFICFSLTSIVMLVFALCVKNFYKSIIPIFLSTIFFIYLFYSNTLSFKIYFDMFMIHPLYWWDMSISEKLFGYPDKQGLLMHRDFGYFSILQDIGLINALVLIVLNLVLIFKVKNIHAIIVTMLHISLIHYQVAISFGVAQIWALHIAFAMHNKYSYK